MRKLLLLFFCLLVLPVANLYAQADSTKKDSAENSKLDNQLGRVQQISAERLADSLKRGNLERQMATLSPADDARKATLLRELIQLKQQDSIRKVRQKQEVDSLRKVVKGFPVTFFHDTLFYVFIRQGSFTAQDRAEAISKRINNISDNYAFKPDSLKLVASEQTMDVLFNNSLLISVSDQDALWQNTTKEKLAAKLKDVIGNAVTRYKAETSLQTLVKEGLLALLVFFVVGLIIYSINRLFKWILAKIHARKDTHFKGIRIKNYQMVNSGQLLGVLRMAITVVKWLVILLVIYLALPILFGIFPFTRDISTTLLGYILNPLKSIGLAVWNYIPNLITIIVLVVVFRYVLRFFRYLKTEVERGNLTIPGFYTDWANPTYQIIRVLVMAFMLIVIFPYMPGSKSPIFQGVSVFVGVLFTFGSAGALGNVVAGLVLTYMRAYKLGDRVKIGEVNGDIIEKNLLVTRIRTVNNEIISIPNSTVMNSHTVNYSSEAQTKGLVVHTTITIGYDVPWRQVHQLLIDAASATAMVEKEPAPYVLQISLDDYYVSYEINAYTKEPNRQAVIYSALHANIQDKFFEAGVEIMSPHYKALRDGNATTIPAEYLPKDYVAPAFTTAQRKSE